MHFNFYRNTHLTSPHADFNLWENFNSFYHLIFFLCILKSLSKQHHKAKSNYIYKKTAKQCSILTLNAHEINPHSMLKLQHQNLSISNLFDSKFQTPKHQISILKSKPPYIKFQF